jgi:hypothetical protein
VHGIVLMELKKYVEQSYGTSTWKALLLAVDLQHRMYTTMGEYPDAEVLAIVQAASEATGKPTDAVLEAFGRFIVPDLVATYGFLVQPGWEALDLIEHTESTIHTVVRTRNGGAPPVLEVLRLGPDRLTIRYTSARRLCALAKGITKGVGDFYETPLDVSESACMSQGSPYCLLAVSCVPAVPPAPRMPLDGEQPVDLRRW